jgi:hypothetical protein
MFACGRTTSMESAMKILAQRCSLAVLAVLAAVAA